MSAALHEDGDYDFGIAARSIADEPGIVLEFFFFAEAAADIVADDLRGAGFPENSTFWMREL